MRSRLGSASTVWLVCFGIGLLFLVRGAFQPYIFPLFENLHGFSYFQIAFLLNIYVFAQSLGAPIAGWYTDRTSSSVALATSSVLGFVSFLLLATGSGSAMSGAAVFVAGLAFVLGKIALNTILVLNSSPEELRSSVAKRAILLNVGSFLGNSIAMEMIARVGCRAHFGLLGLLSLPFGMSLAAATPSLPLHPEAKKKTWGMEHVSCLFSNRDFVADGLRRFAVVLPYGCWGTIIPKYLIDQYHSNDPVWIVSLTSVCTTILCAHLFAVNLADKLARLGFQWEWWSMTSVSFYCSGLMLLMFATTPFLLPVAIAIFICGEVLMTPVFDETAKKHSRSESMGTCMGLLHLVDGMGRLIGAAFALGVYGWMRGSPQQNYYWPVVVTTFFVTATALHFAAHTIARRDR